MCGVFGVVGNSDALDFVGKFEKLAKLSARRGKDAFGLFCSTSKSSSVDIVKIPDSVSKALSSSAYRKFRKALICQQSTVYNIVGHTRLATNGDVGIMENNQPACGVDWVVVHNGIIINESKLKIKYSYSESAELDTYALVSLLDDFSKGKDSVCVSSLLFKIKKEVVGANTFILYSKKFKILIFFSSNGSLYLKENQSGICFASEAEFLEELPGSELLHISGEIAGVWDEESCLFSKINLSDLEGHKSTEIEPNYEIDCDVNSNVASVSGGYSVVRQQLYSLMNDEYEQVLGRRRLMKECSKCLLPECFPGIVFDEAGVCNFCLSHKSLVPTKNINDLSQTLEAYQRSGILVSFSGGRDSSFSLHLLSKELGFKNLKAFTYDWGMVTDLARRNQSRMCGALGVEHIIVSADIQKKRSNIKKNVIAWLEKPSLGTIPLFMAGDKHYFYYADKIRKENQLKLTVMGENKLEKTGFKTKFAGADQKGSHSAMAYNLTLTNKLKMVGHYSSEFLGNSGYWNSSLLDTFTGFLSYYVMPHDYLNVFDYVEWREDIVDQSLKAYEWEYATDCVTSWRIGDGTASFYNYLYFILAGFSENDTLRANQIREGHISLDNALELIQQDNRPRVESFNWYCTVLGLDALDVVKRINKLPKHFNAF